MTPKLSDEQRQALQEHPDKPLRVVDQQTRKVYLMVSEEALPTLWEGYIQREVKRGLEALDRGEVEDWEIDSIKVEGRQILGEHCPKTSR